MNKLSIYIVLFCNIENDIITIDKNISYIRRATFAIYVLRLKTDDSVIALLQKSEVNSSA